VLAQRLADFVALLLGPIGPLKFIAMALRWRLSPPTLLAPILLCLALHRRRIRVLHLEPIGRAAGAVGESFRFDTIPSRPSLQASRKHHLAVLVLKVGQA